MWGKVIRLRPKGCKHNRIFEIVVINQSQRTKGRFVERIGFFNPHFTERFFFIDFQRLGFWLNKGAYLNNSIKKYLVKFG